MSAPYPALSLANLFVGKSLAEHEPTDPMKLQKLLYFSHGYYMAMGKLRNEATPLVDEFFEAWDYGPVLPAVYHAFKAFRSGEITDLAKPYVPTLRRTAVVSPPQGDRRLDKVVDFVWDKYAKHRSMTLSNLTHKSGGAWDRTRREYPGLRGADIKNEYILEDFKSLVSG